MRLGEFIDIIRDVFLVISIVLEVDLDAPAGTVLFQGEITGFQNRLVDTANDVYLDELYLDTIDVDESGMFTIYVC